jgi:hypothetical protein
MDKAAIIKGVSQVFTLVLALVIAWAIINKLEKKACNCNAAPTAEELEQAGGEAALPRK